MSPTKDELIITRTHCPVCGSGQRTILVSLKHDSPGFLNFIRHEKYYSTSFYYQYNKGSLSQFLYEIAECSDCHFLYMTEVLNDRGMGLLYNEWLDKELLKVHYSKLPYSHFEESLLKVIRHKFRKKETIKLMDFGAGYGNFCAKAVKLGFSTFAFDLSTDKNDHLEGMGVKVINNLHGYEGYFDFILVNQVFEHVSDPASILKDLVTSLSPGGIVFLATPDATDYKKLLKTGELSKQLFDLFSPHQHINGFTNRTLRLLGTNAGLKPLAMSDFLGMLSPSLKPPELKFIGKKVIKRSRFGTGLFFKKPA